MIVMEQIVKKHASFRLTIDSLRFRRGLTLLVGKNGAGKSTLLRLLATAELPDSGTIRYGGVTAAEALPIIRTQIGYLPVGLELYEDMTPYKLLNYLAELKGIDRSKKEIDRLLSDFRLEERRNQKIRTLPQGVKQTLGICQALLGSPAFLLLDEPLSYLDGLERRHVVVQLIRYAAAASAACVIVATHELNEWPGADRLLWLDRGEVRYHGAPDCWTDTGDYRASVWTGVVPVEEAAALRNRLSSDESVISQRSVDDAHLELRVIAAAAPAESFNPVPPTIEDAYFIRTASLSARR